MTIKLPPEKALLLEIDQLKGNIDLYKSHVDNCRIEDIARTSSIISFNVSNIRNNILITKSQEKRVDEFVQEFIGHTSRLNGCVCSKVHY